MTTTYTCIGEMRIIDTPEALAAFEELKAVLNTDAYDEVSLTHDGVDYRLMIGIVESEVYNAYPEEADAAICAFTTKFGQEGAVFKVGPEEGDILCLGPYPAVRHQAHVKYLKDKVASWEMLLAAAEDHDGNFDGYLFESEK